MEHQNLNSVLLAAERAETPYILFPEDVAIRLRLSPEHALTAMRLGLLGPWFTVRGVPAVLRETLKEHLRLRMTQRRIEDKELLPGGASTLDERTERASAADGPTAAEEADRG